MDESIEFRRRRLRFRSWHRGTRELDLVLGRFADAYVPRMTPDQLDRYEALLANADPDVYGWISGARPVPPAFDSDIMKLIKNFRYQVL
ncbi:MAG: succinate dehydrogenase assembly factor 2 [Alphaproteobacteria bacterium]